MQITVNGERKVFSEQSVTILELLGRFGVESPDLVSVQLNDKFVPKTGFEIAKVRNGDRLDFLYPIGGGAPMKAYDIPASLSGEIDELESLMNAFRSNAVPELKLKAHLALFGVYEQRTQGSYIVRIRCTAGIITPMQLNRVAHLSLQFASGRLHITTRQEIQVHDLAINDLIPIIRELAKADLSTRGGGGNTVRNIIVPWDSGISTTETFDVTPYAVALTSRFMALPDSWQLPRKFKIAFGNSDSEPGLALVNDIGCIPVSQEGMRGFRIYVGGGLGRQSQLGELLHGFIRDSDLFIVAEAIKRVFFKFGDRSNRSAARFRFLWNSLGKERFIDIYEKERQNLNASILNSLTIREPERRIAETRLEGGFVPKSAEFSQWKTKCVRPQKQPDLASVIVPFRHGDLEADVAKQIADAAAMVGEDTIRFTVDQNIAIRNIPVSSVGSIVLLSKRISEISCLPSLIGNAVTCTGSETCRLGICHSPQTLDAIIGEIKNSGIDLDAAGDVRLHISGCPNACGQHLIADLGFCGKLSRQGDESIKSYSIFAGADINNLVQPTLARKIGEISSQNLPKLVVEIFRKYLDREAEHSSLAEYLKNGDYKDITTLSKY